MKKKRSSSSKAPSLVDVAKLAGVSAITVSRTIRSPEMVSSRLRLKVETAIKRLGYSPNLAASALASKVTANIGLLLPSLTNNVFNDVLRGIYDTIGETRFFIQIGNSRYSALNEEALIRTFLRQKPAGLIITGFDQTDVAREMLTTAHCPIVQIMDFRQKPFDMAIGFDHVAAGFTAGRHLLDCGYRRLGYIGARLDPRSQRRLIGFRNACKEVAPLEEMRIAASPQPSSVGLGRQLLELLLSRAPDTDAVFCNNDDLGIGALMEAKRRLISVPEDLGICSFHDMEMTQHMYPALTAIATPRLEIGERAIRMLLNEIETPGTVAERIVDTGFRLMARETTRKAN